MARLLLSSRSRPFNAKLLTEEWQSLFHSSIAKVLGFKNREDFLFEISEDFHCMSLDEDVVPIIIEGN